MIIAIEGIDGSGKTTLAKQLYGHLNGSHKMIHFPSAGAARTIISLDSARARAMVYAADFVETMPKAPADLILDRYVGSHYAYSPDVHNLDSMVFGLPVPDITILCVCDIYDAFERRNGAHPLAELKLWQDRYMEYYARDTSCLKLGEDGRLERATSYIDTFLKHGL